MGDREEALRPLRTFLEINPWDRASIAKDDTWWLRGLRDDPRFRAIVGVAHQLVGAAFALAGATPPPPTAPETP